MSELDITKEEIGYLKLWLGIMIVTNISLVGWFISNYDNASAVLLVLDVIAVVAVSIGARVIHRQIEAKIERLREL